jgi:hypothetical protein
MLEKALCFSVPNWSSSMNLSGLPDRYLLLAESGDRTQAVKSTQWRAAGLKFGEIEHGFDLEIGAQSRAWPVCRPPIPAMKSSRADWLRPLRAIGRHCQRGGHVVNSTIPRLTPMKTMDIAARILEGSILRQRGDEGIGLTQGVPTADVVGRQKQQAVLFKKFAAARVTDGEKSFRMRPKTPGECGRCLFGEFWRRGIDDDDNPKLGERLHVLQRSLCPGQIVRYQFVYVGLDSEVFRRIDAGCCRDSNCASGSTPGVRYRINHG